VSDILNQSIDSQKWEKKDYTQCFRDESS